MQRLNLYLIDMKYIRDLHRIDDNVPSVSPQIGKESRVFLGVVVLCNGKKYCVPLSHPKKKHARMRGSIDFTKIYDGDKMIAVLNFNLMLPVSDIVLQPVDLQIHRNDSESIRHYKRNSDQKFSARARCLNFLALESACKKYEEKHA